MTRFQLTLTPIAIAVLALASGTAQSAVKIGGKFDAGYQFKRTANNEFKDGNPDKERGFITSEAQGDGGASTSRITFSANEKVNKHIESFVDFDLRFTNVHEGKGGLNNNDKKVMGLRTSFGKVTWGTYNITNLHIADKPYMTNVKDMEIVKFGISKPTQSDLTNRNTELVTPTLSFGQAHMLLKGNFAFGDNRKSGMSDDQSTIATQGSGDAMSLGYELVLGKLKDREFTMSSVVVRRAPSSNVNQDGYMSWDTSITYKPAFINGLKLSSSYFAAKGYLNGPDTAYQYKGTNFVVSYNYDKLWQVGVGISHAHDLGSNRNSGRAFMLGGAYWLSKNTYLYAGVSKADWERNETLTNGKYNGTKAGFKDTLKKLDERYTRFGIVTEF